MQFLCCSFRIRIYVILRSRLQLFLSIKRAEQKANYCEWFLTTSLFHHVYGNWSVGPSNASDVCVMFTSREVLKETNTREEGII